MTEVRILRERRKAINYYEDEQRPSAQRLIAGVCEARRSTRSIKSSGETDKENERKRKRRDAHGSSESDSGNGTSRPPPKRALRENDRSSDIIEDSDREANPFIMFARLGKRPASRQPGQELVRRGRVAATRGSHRIDAATTVEDPTDEDDDMLAATRSSRRVGRPTRRGAAAPRERVERHMAARSKGRGSKSLKASESEEEEDDEDSGGSGGSAAGTKSGGGNDSDVVMLDSSSSGSDDEAHDDESKEYARPAKRSVAPGTRPKRECAVKTAARVTASLANASKGGPRHAPESDDSEVSDSDDDEEEDEDFKVQGVVGKRRAAERGGGQRQSTRMKSTVSYAVVEGDEDEESDEDEEESDEDSSSDEDESDKEEEETRHRGESGDSEDSDVRLDNRGDNEDSGEDSSDSSAGEEDPEDEAPICRGRGRPLKEGPMTGNSVSRQKHSVRGSGAKGKATAATAKNKADTKCAAVYDQSDKGKEEEGDDDEDEDDDDDDYEEEEQEKRNAKNKRIAVARRSEYSGLVQKILSYDPEQDKYRVKLEGVSYRHTAYVTTSYLEKATPFLLRFFLQRGKPFEIDPHWLKVDRIIASKSSGGRQASRQLLVKWRGLEYSDSTWEYENDLTSKEDKAAIARFEQFEPPGRLMKQPSEALRHPAFEFPKFCNGRALRNYQQVSVRWMVNNYCQRRNCILGDEMGLGKTAQSISCLEVLRSLGGVQGPFLIVAPLSTLGHWQREIETWTEMSVVVFGGTAEDRAMAVKHEFYQSETAGGGKGRNRRLQIRFNVLLTSYETLRKERNLLRNLSWAAVIFDEAHRLKGINSSIRSAVEELEMDWMLLLTGTPIQNNMLELFSILSLLDPDGYPSPEDFAKRFGGAPGGAPPSVEQIRALQAALAPILLRRMKEDVEELPQKEEVVVWVELTAYQRAYYRAMYEGQIEALLAGGSTKNLPAMRNLAMQLRKLCCHSVLCDGVEDELKCKLMQQRSMAAPDVPQEFETPELELLVRGSGKMVLLHKLLHKLRAEGRRVLIFSQFVIMLNVLEDYCTAVGFPVERIDGTITGRERQQAIDRFSAGGEGNDSSFVFLLSTRAGGQGITLTTADTCIIYDSDWNPQNDLQAMARCHRIGQKKEVTVYRLISRDTYEMALFNAASRKYGLDEAILGFSAGTDPESDAARISDLLRHGAHGLLADMEAGLQQGEAFASEDINQILAARTEKRQIGNRAGNNFSVATFAVGDGGGCGDLHRGRRRGRGHIKRLIVESDDAEHTSDKDYWRTLMPEAVAAHEARAAKVPEFLGPRKRRQVNYNVNDKNYGPKLDSSDSSDSENEGAGKEDDGDGSKGDEAKEKKRQMRKSKQQGTGTAEGETGQDGAAATGGKGRSRKITKTEWSKTELRMMEDRLLALGPDRWGEIYEQLQPFKHSAEEVETAGRAMWALYEVAAGLAAEREAQKKKAKEEALAQFIANQSLLDEDDAMLFNGPKTKAANPPVPGVAGAGGTAAAPAAVAAAPLLTPRVNNTPDDFEEKLMKTIPDKVPEFLHKALSDLPPVRRLMREAAENLRHGKCMQELHRLMFPLKQPQEQAGAAGTTAAAGVASSNCGSHAVDGLRACYQSPPLTPSGFLDWWSRADDEALLMAAAQVGYRMVTGKHLRTIEHALRSQHLAGRVVQIPESQDGAPAGAEAGGDATACASGAPSTNTPGAPAAPGVVPKAGEAGGNPAPAETGKSKPSPAAPAPRVPGPNAPVQLSPDEWRTMLGLLGRRLSRIIPLTLEHQRKLAAGASKQPLMLVKPSGPLLNRDLAAAPASGAGAAGGRLPSNVTGLDALPTATPAAAAIKAIPDHHQHQHHDHSHKHSHNQHSQHQHPVEPQRRASGDFTQRQPDRQVGGPPATAPAGGPSSKQGSLKQGTIPFARMGNSGTQPKSTLGSGEGNGSGGKLGAQPVSVASPSDRLMPSKGSVQVVSGKVTEVVSGASAHEQPGSAEQPINIDDSE
ncbi:hypothetical protein VaNZ11_001224 [Volvox africanus]|uniref:Uncharacterized protein n=1 Tax=Volvox africanus TaxID=51714 RepID=A0ABQ5RQ35_9CHLO|nr:hypothetical protein VaNZ11_001224 [Volvox africanus]